MYFSYYADLSGQEYACAPTMSYKYPLLVTFFSFLILANPAQAAYQCPDIPTNCTPQYQVGAQETFKDIEPAIKKAETDGSRNAIICIKNDKEYLINNPINIKLSGTIDQPFVVRGYPGQTAPKIKNILPYSSNTIYTSAINITGSNVILENIEVAQSPGRGIVTENVENVGLYNVTVHHTYDGAIKIIRSDRVTVDGCHVYEAGIRDAPACKNNPQCAGVNSNWPEIVNMVQSTNGIMRNCRIYNVYGGTFSTGRSQNMILANSIIYDSKRPLLHLDQTSNVTLENNLVFTSQNATDIQVSRAGLYKLDEGYPPSEGFNYFQSQGHTRKIHNNMFINTDMGLQIGGCEKEVSPPCVLRNDSITNNTFINIHTQVFEIVPHETSQNNLIKNNVFHSINPNPIAKSFVNTGITSSQNLWSAAPPTNLSSPDDLIRTGDQFSTIFINPTNAFNLNLVQPNNIDPLNYKLKAAYAQFGADASLVGPQTCIPIPAGSDFKFSLSQWFGVHNSSDKLFNIMDWLNFL